MAVKHLRGIALFAMIVIPQSVLAHSNVGEISSLANGFHHPISGLDHSLAMALVGMLALQFGGRAVWVLPATFVGVMAGGGALAIAGVEIPYVETGIALSVIAFGAALAFNVRASLAVAMTIIGMFAIFHGYAHGVEMPTNAGGSTYAAGFMLATALLHATGVAFNIALIRLIGDRKGLAVIRSAGAVAAGAGIGLFTGLI